MPWPKGKPRPPRAPRPPRQPRKRKRKYKEHAEGSQETSSRSKSHPVQCKKKRKVSRTQSSDTSIPVPALRKSKRLQQKKEKRVLTISSTPPSPKRSKRCRKRLRASSTSRSSNSSSSSPTDNDRTTRRRSLRSKGSKSKSKSRSKLKARSKKSRSRSKSNNEFESLFPDALYSLLEVFFVGYSIDGDGNDDDSSRNDLMEWLWLWERRASSHYRILISTVYHRKCFEIRIDSKHGIPCELFGEFLCSRLTFEYYYAYSRRDVFGGWKFCHQGKVMKEDIYGPIFGGTTGPNAKKAVLQGKVGVIQPSKIWKQIIWFQQLQFSLIWKKYGNKMHHAHFLYGHHDLNGDMNMNANGRLDDYSYNMNQLFDAQWRKSHEINAHAIKLNADEMSLMLGTTMQMICSKCGQTSPLCRAVNLCECFYGCFTATDLYLRHRSMVMDFQ